MKLAMAPSCDLEPSKNKVQMSVSTIELVKEKLFISIIVKSFSQAWVQ
jgi:hypothetical protein